MKSYKFITYKGKSKTISCDSYTKNEVTGYYDIITNGKVYETLKIKISDIKNVEQLPDVEPITGILID